MITIIFSDGARGVALSETLYLVLQDKNANLDFSLRRAWLGEVDIRREEEDEYAHMQIKLMDNISLIQDGRKYRQLKELLK